MEAMQSKTIVLMSLGPQLEIDRDLSRVTLAGDDMFTPVDM